MEKNKEVSSLLSQYMAGIISTAYYVPLKLGLFKIDQIFIRFLFCTFIKTMSKTDIVTAFSELIV